MLFDGAREAGLHKYGAIERELLRYASLLHDIGLFLSFEDHHAHSRYMIKNSTLLGFNQREIDVIANAAYFHRKWSEKKNRADVYYNSMNRNDKRLARTLGVFLRMGEGLDRSQRQTITEAQLSRARVKRVELRLAISSPSPIEIYATQRASAQFKKIFGTDYNVVTEYAEDT
jgi:exopolyphosphatase/guanosine-5'-triphosphate,3'-diphosphate pyrophosphatase